MTRAQALIVDLIATAHAEGGVSPTLQEMGDAIGISKSNVHGHVERLIRARVLRRDAGFQRNLMIVDPTAEPLAAYSTADLRAELQRREGRP